MRVLIKTLIVMSLLLAGPAAFSAPSLRDCQDTMGKFKELGNVSELLGQSYGYAVMPTIGKGGAGMGGVQEPVLCLDHSYVRKTAFRTD